VTFKLSVALFDVTSDSSFWNDPQFSQAVFRGSSKQIIIEGRKSAISYVPVVSFDKLDIIIKSSEAVCWEYGDRAGG
jgi:hypothetical protein